MALFAALRQRSFAFLWSGQAISGLGDSLYRIALAWWVLKATGSATAMGTVLIFSSVPNLIMLPVGGWLVDRFHRPGLMLASDMMRLLVVGAVALLDWTGTLALWHVYVAGMVFGVVDAVFTPAYSAIVPGLVPKEALPSANSLTSLTRQLASVIGPGLGAAIIALGSAPLAFALDSASFLVSALCLLPLLNLPANDIERQPDEPPLKAIRAGFGTVLASPWLWVTIGVASLSNLTIAGPVSVSLPFLINQHLGGEVGALGTVLTMEAAGQVIGAVWLGRRKTLRRRGLLLYGAWMASAVLVLSIGLMPSLAGVSLAMLLFGIGISFLNLVWIHSLQELVPAHLLGRVVSIDYLGSGIFVPIGFALAGWATDRIGAPLVFVLGGAVSIGLIALGLLHPRVRNLD